MIELVADLSFLFKVIHGQVNRPELVAALTFLAPQKQLSPRPFFDFRPPAYYPTVTQQIQCSFDTFRDSLHSRFVSRWIPVLERSRVSVS